MTPDETREVHENRDVDGEWSEDPVSIAVKGSSSQVVSFRLPTDEFALLLDAVERSGEKLSEFVRGAVILRIYAKVSRTAIDVMSRDLSGKDRLQFTTRGSENPLPVSGEVFPNLPPAGVA